MKIAVVSGASSGIGLCLSKELDKLSLDEIWLIARNEQRLTSLSAELNTKSRVFALDLTDTDAFKVLTDALKSSEAEIEYLACSAGVGYNGAFSSLNTEQISRTVELNCSSLAILISVCLPNICEGGKIINIASGAGFLPQPNFSVYAASKSFVISLSRALNEELKHRKISVTAVCPGPVDTEFFSNLENVKEYKKKYLISPYSVAIKALRDAKKKRAVSTPTFSMKLVHLASKIVPTSLLLKFYK